MTQPCTDREERIISAIVHALRQSELHPAATILRRKRRACTTPVRDLSLVTDLKVAEENLPRFFVSLSEILVEQKILPEEGQISIYIRPATIDDLQLYLLDLNGFSSK